MNLRLRLAWGGGTPRSWQGSVTITGGSLAEIVPLGMEADVPGSMQMVEGAVKISRRGTRTFDGLDLLVTGPPEAKLSIELAPGDDNAKPQRMELTLASAIDDVHSSALDEQNNRLIVRRAPGDKLRVKFERDSLVFEPGEEFGFEISPHLAGLAPDAHLRCHVQLLKARTETEVWGREFDAKADAGGAVPPIGPVSLELPVAEGVYDVLISLYPRRAGPSLTRPRALVQRKVQLIVLDVKPPSHVAAEWKAELEIDPANPRWWDRLKGVPQLKIIPGLGQGPLGNGKLQVRAHRGQNWVQLDADGWQAYPLPVSRVGEPHVLEVEYPSDLKQTLGISLIEPNAAGAVAPLGLDSGVDVSESVGTPRVERHRLTFWPRTKAPVVLFTNRRHDAPAVFGKLRVLGGPAVLSPAPLVKNARGQRLFAAYLDKPLFPENFGASEALDAATNRSLDDWETFYQGGRRLVEYLNHAGYNGALVSVACEGSAIYPSRLLEPTPKYDSGTFFVTGQDPLRKDVLEMLLRLFDREGLRLIPAIGFSSPLPELEALREAGPQGVGLELVDFEGKTWLARHGAARGLAPHYNPLDSRVQAQMLAVARELAERYGSHPAFGGLALQLGPETYAQLPGEQWGYDEATLARFARRSGVDLDLKGADRSSKRSALFVGEARGNWLAWRASVIADLHLRMQQTVAKARPDARLYLAGADLFTGKEMQEAIRPTLPPHVDLAEALLRVGIDAALYAERPEVVFLRPERISSTTSLAAQAVNLEVRQASDADRLFGASREPGNLFFHEPRPLRLPSFDEASPFGAKHTYTWLATLATPGGPQNRQRFIRALAAADSQTFVDGGWMTPLGQEESLRPLIDAFRSLPAERFATLTTKTPDGRTQPITVRTLSRDDRTYFYLVNNSPWPAAVELEIDAPADCRLEPLARRRLPPLTRTGNRARWTVTLEPYDLAAGVLVAPRVRIDNWQVTLPAEAKAELEQRVQQVRARANALKNPQPLAVLRNGGFEISARQKGVPGWVQSAEPGLTISLDQTQKRGGEQSLLLRSDDAVAWVRSEPFDCPATGRLAVWVWLRIADPKKQPPLRLAIEGRTGGEVYYKFANVGVGADAPQLASRWAPYLFQVDDLPAAGLTDLRVGFDLMGPGEVWIDDVQVFDAWFYDNERDELLKNIALADVDLGAHRVADCQRFLESYWPQFLLAHVSVDNPRVAAKPVEGRLPLRDRGKPPPAKPSLLERMKLPFSRTPPVAGATKE